MSVPLPNDYAERVYAGVLGKVIGVYLGRPFGAGPMRKSKSNWVISSTTFTIS